MAGIFLAEFHMLIVMSRLPVTYWLRSGKWITDFIVSVFGCHSSNDLKKRNRFTANLFSAIPILKTGNVILRGVAQFFPYFLEKTSFSIAFFYNQNSYMAK